jgi:signal transduction histidine kinase
LFFSLNAIAQSHKADSLLRVLDTTVSEERRARVHLQLSKVYERSDLEKAKMYARRALRTKNDSILSDGHNQLGRNYFYSNQLDSSEYHFIRAIKEFKVIAPNDKIAAVKVSLGAVQLRKGEYKEAVHTLIESASFFEEQKDSINMAKCYSNISSAFGELGNHQKAIEYGEKALNLQKQKNVPHFQVVTLPNVASHYLKTGDTVMAKKYYFQAEKLAVQLQDQFSLARIYNNLGNIHLESDYNSAEFYLKKSLALREKSKYLDGIGILYNNMGYLYLQKKAYPQALPYFERAMEYSEGLSKIPVLNNLSDTYEAMGNHLQALRFAQQKFELKDSILQSEKQKDIAEISSKYETEKKEKEILSLQKINLETELKQRQTRNLLIGSLVLLTLTIVLTYMWLKNARRKRFIAEQRQQIESQKVDKLMKDQELIGLDAMIEGQEKESLRISADLHDSLGGKLSTIRLYLQNEESFNDKELRKKIMYLLDESYEETRSIAHEENSGLMLEKGLIPAVKLVANRITKTKELRIDVVNIDLDKKVRNAVALQLFRIIQELLSNTIKHAEANEVTIQFSEDNDTLNMIFEDDGKGFEMDKVNSGLGFSNIESRIRRLDGVFNIDSSPENGTTIIINVPL